MNRGKNMKKTLTTILMCIALIIGVPAIVLGALQLMDVIFHTFPSIIEVLRFIGIVIVVFFIVLFCIVNGFIKEK